MIDTHEYAAGARFAEHRLQFTGSGGEYFRIWIVNLLFSILTLGLYSAWAKVRREQYFHRNTLLDGSGFDYHGNPKAILKGRILAVGIFAALSLVDWMEHALYYPVLLAFSPLIPWFLIRSFVFRSRNTSYRGLHFGFLGTYKAFCVTFLLPCVAQLCCAWLMIHASESIERSLLQGDMENAPHWLLAVALAGIVLLIPVLLHRLKSFQFNHLVFGASRFENALELKSFFGISLRFCLCLALGIALLLVAAAALGLLSFGSGAALGQAPKWLFPLVPFFVLFAYTLLFIVPSAYFTALLTNLVWNGVRLGGHRFKSDQTFAGIARLVILNWLFILLTLGFYWPWAKIRLARYRAEHTAMLVAGSLDEFIGGVAREQSAYGEEIADFFDFDLGF